MVMPQRRAGGRGSMMDEAQPRQKLIDERLRLAGWDVHDASQVIQELDIHLAEAGIEVEIDPVNPHSGHQFADYALVPNGKPIDADITTEVRDNWHESKQRFTADRIQTCIDWIREQNVTPTGTGTCTEARE